MKEPTITRAVGETGSHARATDSEASAPPERGPRPALPDPREVVRAASAEALGHSMARRVF